ncbi:MAG: hypothetical protein AAF993_15360 [Pseudomonadota bacterium]
MTDSLCHLCLAAPAAQRVKHYGIAVCRGCWQRASSGWPPEFEPALRQALARQGLLIPDRNSQQRLPRDYQPPADYAL